MAPEVDDEPGRVVERADAEIDLLFDADRPRKSGLEVAGADGLPNDRRAGFGPLDPARTLVDEAPFVRREVEARCRLHAYEENSLPGDRDLLARAVLDDRPVDVLDLVAGPQVLELEDDTVEALVTADGDALEQRRTGLLGGTG